MFTIKYVNEQGEENITACAHVIADHTDDNRRRVLVFDTHPTWAKDNSSGIYVSSGQPPQPGQFASVLYVMNQHGATVAKYDL